MDIKELRFILHDKYCYSGLMYMFDHCDKYITRNLLRKI